ncbi:MAG: EamA family transporter RarD [Actinomycetota bacterium]
MPRFAGTGWGFSFALGAYLIWGSFPIIIAASAFASPFEVVVWRVVFGFLFALALVLLGRSWRQVWQLVKNPRKLGWLGVAALFIFVNWQVYVVAVVSGNVIESSLGYFINPIFTVLLGVLVLRERLRLGQWVALAIGLVAVAVLTIDYGRLPIIALALAFSFGIYSLAKNKVGGKISALHSFTIESGILLPVALIQLAVTAMFAPIQFGVAGVAETLLLISFGFLTAIPLILFGAAASRIPLSSIGFIQYLTPMIQFLLGIFYFQEEMPLVRWFGFSLVWLGLVVLTVDALRAAGNRRRSSILTEHKGAMESVPPVG